MNVQVFNNPEDFQSERYLKNGKPNVRDPDCAAFGFGRWSVSATIYSPTYTSFHSNSSPVMSVSDNSLYSIVYRLLAVLHDDEPPVDDQGHSLKPKPEFTTGMLCKYV